MNGRGNVSGRVFLEFFLGLIDCLGGEGWDGLAYWPFSFIFVFFFTSSLFLCWLWFCFSLLLLLLWVLIHVFLCDLGFNCERLGLICASASASSKSGRSGGEHDDGNSPPSTAAAAELGKTSSSSSSRTIHAAAAAALSTGTPAGATAGLKRKRTYRSCSHCRASKTRCSGHKPICVRCREKSLKCRYEDESEPAWKRRVSATVVATEHPTPSSDSARTDSNLSPQSLNSPIKRADATPVASLGLGSPGTSPPVK